MSNFQCSFTSETARYAGSTTRLKYSQAWEIAQKAILIDRGF